MSNSLNDAELVDLTAGGFLVGLTDDPVPTFLKISISDVQQGVDLAASAVQPESLGEAATMTVAEIEGLIDAKLGSLEASLEAILTVIG